MMLALQLEKIRIKVNLDVPSTPHRWAVVDERTSVKVDDPPSETRSTNPFARVAPQLAEKLWRRCYDRCVTVHRKPLSDQHDPSHC
jgi:hypothetical protein